MATQTKTEKALESAKTRAKNLAKRLAGGVKGTIYAGGAGVAASYAVPAVQDAVETLQDPLYMGGALVLGGHLLKSKQLEAGAALCGIGGYLIGQWLQEDKEETKTSGASQTSTTAGLQVPDAAGWSMLESRPDAGALTNAPQGRGGAISGSPEPRALVQDTRVVLSGRDAVKEAAALFD